MVWARRIQVARVVFTSNLQRHVACPTQDATGTTVRQALESVFANAERLRTYILDDQDQLRHHVHIFVDGEMIRDRVTLSDPIKESSELYVMQALSGG